ncbi:MAG: fatty acyl-AMP ligase [Deltaproteobacteria bacterium]|nr:fatty acyl-AMP ligase [Deltaproteobacteria bacterium]
MILESLIARAEAEPARTAFSIAARDEIRSQLSYAQLVQRSLVAAGNLARAGLRRGERVLVCLPTGEDLLVTMFGVLLAGGVCVPMYPLSVGQGLERWRAQIAAIVRVAQPRGAVVLSYSRAPMAAALAERRGDSFILEAAQLKGGDPASPCLPGPTDLALVQFTSGTTREPRGVAITHGALSANVEAIVAALGLDDRVVSVSWLPPYHDMGLVGHVFTPIVCGAHQVLLPTSHFLVRPACWLRLLSRVKATQTTSPNTGYSMCVHRVPREQRAGLDLSHLRQALVGAEPVLPDTLDAFAQAFEPAGFSPTAFRPVYGMAEATLGVTFSLPGGAAVDWVARNPLAERARAEPDLPNAPGARGVVCVGAAAPGHEVRVASADGQTCEPRQVGEIWFRGPSLMQSYFNNPQATSEVFVGDWLRTGDLGYLADGLLYVTGRLKELVIKGGRNYVPADIEAAIDGEPEVRRGRVVAFGLQNRTAGTEDIVVVAEVRDRRNVGNLEVAQRLTGLITERAGVRPDRLDLLPAGTLTKTSSGKLQRAAVRRAYEQGVALRAPTNGVWLLSPGLELLRGRAWAIAELGRSKARAWLNWR